MRKELIISVTVALSVISCGSSSSTNRALSGELPDKFIPNDGRLLASNCYGCHGTNGVSVTKWDSIAGEDELHEEMFEKDGIMLAQAKGYSDEEIDKMEEFIKSLKEADEEEEKEYIDDDDDDDDDDDEKE
jgi:cytochrome c553